MKPQPKNCAVFRADSFPDDTVEDGDDIQVFPGRNIAEALIPILKHAGCTEISEPLDRDEHGWEVLFRSDGKRFLLQVSRIEPETILDIDKNYGFEGFFHRGPSRLEVLTEKLQPLIAADRRFKGLTWYTRDEMRTVNYVAALGESESHGAGDV